MQKPSRKTAVIVSVIAGTMIAGAYVVQSFVGNHVVAISALPPSHYASMARMETILIERPPLIELFNQPLFDTGEWREYADKTNQADATDKARGRAASMKLVDAMVWLPGLNSHYKDLINDRLDLDTEILDSAEASAIGAYYGACVQHDEGLTDAEVHAMIDRPDAPFTEIIDYAIRECDLSKR